MEPSNYSPCVISWSVDNVQVWLEKNKFPEEIRLLFESARIDGKALLLLNENDLKSILTTQVINFNVFFDNSK